MPIEFRCNQCGKLLRTGDDTAGMQAKCPSCSAVVPIPSDAAPASGASVEPHAAGMTSSPVAPPPPPPGADPDNPYQSPGVYPTTPAGPPPPGNFQPTVIDFGDIFSRSWTIFQDQWGMSLLVLFLVFLFNQIAGNGLSYGGLFLGRAVGSPILAEGLSWLGMIMGLLLNIWIGIGQAVVFLNIARGDPVEIGQLFTGGPYFPRILGASIIATFALVLGFALLIVPGVFLILMFWPFYWLIIDRNVGVFDSFQLARQVTDGNKATVFLLMIVMLALTLVSAIPCGLGLLVTIPFFNVMWPVMYLAMTGQATADQRFRRAREWSKQGWPSEGSGPAADSQQ